MHLFKMTLAPDMNCKMAQRSDDTAWCNICFVIKCNEIHHFLNNASQNTFEPTEYLKALHNLYSCDKLHQQVYMLFF